MKKNKGFSGIEVLVVIAIYVIVFSVISIFTLNSTKKTRLQSLKYDAVAFANNVRTYRIYNNIDTVSKVYLKDIVAYDDSYNITSPFNGDNNCSYFESYVNVVNGNEKVTLKCDNYILDNYSLDDDDYDVFYVSDWKESKPLVDEEIEKQVLYNYKKDNKYVLDEFVPLDVFIKYYKLNVSDNVTNISDLKDYDKKTVYRFKKNVSI